MGDLTKGYTFTAGEVVTPAKLHALVESAEIKAGMIGTTELADAAVTSAKLDAGLTMSVSKIVLANGKVMVGNGSGVGSEVLVDTDTMDAAGFGVKDGGIGATQLATGAVTTAKILDANVTLAKLANIATARLLGRATAGSGVPEEISLGTGLEFDSGALRVTSAVSGGTVSKYTSSNVSVPSTETVTSFTHGLGGLPIIVQGWLECTTADSPFSVGDSIPLTDIFITGWTPAWSIIATSTSVLVARYASAAQLLTFSRSDGRLISSPLTEASWRLKVSAIR